MENYRYKTTADRWLDEVITAKPGKPQITIKRMETDNGWAKTKHYKHQRNW